MFKFNPARSVAAFGVLSHSVITLLAKLRGWDADTVLLVYGVEGAGVTFLGTLFVEAKSVSMAALNALKSAEDKLDK